MYIKPCKSIIDFSELSFMLKEYLEELHAINEKVEVRNTVQIEREYFHNSQNTLFYLLLDEDYDDRIAGFAIIGTKSNCHSKCDLYIEEFYIDPFYRSKGQGIKFINSLLDLFNPKRICFYILKNNNRATVFWEKALINWKDISLSIKDELPTLEHLTWKVYESA